MQTFIDRLHVVNAFIRFGKAVSCLGQQNPRFVQREFQGKGITYYRAFSRRVICFVADIGKNSAGRVCIFIKLGIDESPFSLLFKKIISKM